MQAAQIAVEHTERKLENEVEGKRLNFYKSKNIYTTIIARNEVGQFVWVVVSDEKLIIMMKSSTYSLPKQRFLELYTCTPCTELDALSVMGANMMYVFRETFIRFPEI